MGGRAASRHFPDWIAAYCGLKSHTEAPEKFHFWTAVSTIAGALRRHVWKDQGEFKLYPNFFIVFVGEPGIVTKSTAINGGLRFLREIGANIGPSVATWQGFLKRLEQSTEGFSVDNPSTPLAQRKHVTTCAVTMHITEWGTFIDPRDHLMVNMLTDLWDCKDGVAIDKTTATQGDVAIINPFVNMLAATTPSWMRDNIKAQFGGWGLSSRIIFVYASEPRQVIAWPDRARRPDAPETQRLLVEDLRQISRLSGPFEIDDNLVFEGQTWREAHLERHKNLMVHSSTNPWLRHFLARKYDYAVKLALVLSASRRDDHIITTEDWREAVTRMGEVECELDFIFGEEKGEVSASRAAKINHVAWTHLEKGLRSNGRMQKTHVHRFISRYMDYRSAEDFLNQLLASSLVVQEQDKDGLWVTLTSA